MSLLYAIIFSQFLAHSQTASERPDFKIKSIKIAEKTIKVEVADNNIKRAYGLMFRKDWKSIEGMIFIFPDESPRSFWMKNTFLPLSVGFFDAKGVLKEIGDLKPMKSVLQKKTDSLYSKEPAKYVLEVPKGWFAANSVAIGAKLKIL